MSDEMGHPHTLTQGPEVPQVSGGTRPRLWHPKGVDVNWVQTCEEVGGR